MNRLAMFSTLAMVVAAAACQESLPTSDASFVDGVDETASVHESNNRAELAGTQGGEAITGSSIVNFTGNGMNAWRSNVNVKGDLDAGTYSFYVISPDGTNRMLVCTFSVPGRQGCSSDTNVGGFATAEVEDGSGAVVASGSYARRGGNRFKE